MRIAIVYGKGLEGCGVQRNGVEMQNWCLKNGIDFDIYSLVERVFSRANGHDMQRTPIEFKAHQMKDIAKLLEAYDVVVLNSIPSHKHEHSTTISFYRDLVCALEKPILVGMMHEIRQSSIDSHPLVIQILNECDIIYHFSTETWFSTNIPNILPSKKLGERMRRFRLWMDIGYLENNYRNVYSLDDKARRMTFIGRWSSMKDPRRLLDLGGLMKDADPSFHCAIHGIERSIGAKFDVIEHPMCKYAFKFEGEYNPDPNFVNVYGPYARADGLKYIAESLFGASFWYMPKDPHNYGNRMEYAQIEIIGCGSIPVFDKHNGENNKAENGKRYIDHDYLAVWSDKNDLPDTIDQLITIANDKKLQTRYRDSSFEFVRDEFNINTIMPVMLNDIITLGKDNNKFKNINEHLMHFYSDSGAVDIWNELINNGICPAVGFKQFETKTLSKFVGKARQVIVDYSKKRKKKTSDNISLADFME